MLDRNPLAGPKVRGKAIMGYIFMAQAAPKHLREGGVILNTGSVTALKGNPGLIVPSAPANEFAAVETRCPPARTGRPGCVRRPRHLRVRYREVTGLEPPEHHSPPTPGMGMHQPAALHAG
jgi:NAD(P)-dependent dehydrogenase (short-subunit alcohol dehydrogenase family)